MTQKRYATGAERQAAYRLRKATKQTRCSEAVQRPEPVHTVTDGKDPIGARQILGGTGTWRLMNAAQNDLIAEAARRAGEYREIRPLPLVEWETDYERALRQVQAEQAAFEAAAEALQLRYARAATEAEREAISEEFFQLKQQRGIR